MSKSIEIEFFEDDPLTIEFNTDEECDEFAEILRTCKVGVNLHINGMRISIPKRIVKDFVVFSEAKNE